MKFFTVGLLALAAAGPFGLAHEHDETESHEAGTVTIAPSPTESVGCEAHGDHWHCEGPRVTGESVITSAPMATGTDVSIGISISTDDHETHTDDHDDHDDHETHTDDEGSGTLAPSPTGSVGCEAHGDHWHCDGPVEASTTLSVIVTDFPTGNITSTGSSPEETSSTPNAAPQATAAIIAPLAAIMGIVLAL